MISIIADPELLGKIMSPNKKMNENSSVNHPSHYNEIPDWEVIDTIRRDLTREEFIGFLKGNILKYRLRAGNKGDALEDIAKADWCKGVLIKYLNNDR